MITREDKLKFLSERFLQRYKYSRNSVTVCSEDSQAGISTPALSVLIGPSVAWHGRLSAYLPPIDIE